MLSTLCKDALRLIVQNTDMPCSECQKLKCQSVRASQHEARCSTVQKVAQPVTADGQCVAECTPTDLTECKAYYSLMMS